VRRRLQTIASFYARIARTYTRWAPFLLLLGTIVFVPLGLVDAIAVHFDLRSLDVENGAVLFAVVVTTLALAGTGLIGEVFYSGAVAVALTHPHDGRPPSLREIAGRLKYRRLIAVDLLYTLIVSVGILLFVAPGTVAFVWLGLAGPVVEIEGRGIRAAFARSLRLVRGRFWLVFFVLVPVEIAGDGLANLATSFTHHLLGSSLPAEWLSESLANIVLTPAYAVAAVLLTLDLIAEKDGDGPRLRPQPVVSA
jgi:hypothetical protein